MDKDFELSRRERFDALLMRKGDLAKSNEYYNRISPTESAEVDAKQAAAAEAAAKKKTAAAAAVKPAPPGVAPASSGPAPSRSSS